MKLIRPNSFIRIFLKLIFLFQIQLILPIYNTKNVKSFKELRGKRIHSEIKYF